MVKRNLAKKRRPSDPEMVGQRRPKGTPDTATVAWKLKVRARLTEIGMSRAEFSRQLRKATGSGTTAMVSQFLGREDEEPKESSTKLRPAIHKILGWEPPVEDVAEKIADGLRDRLSTVWPDLDDTDRALIDLIVARHTKAD